MKKLMCLFTILIVFSCEKKESQYSKELQQIFDAHGLLKAWQNVNTVSFDVDDKSCTFDTKSKKKVINAANYSLGFDGEKYWVTKNSPVSNPEAYINSLFESFLIPFSLVDKEQTNFKKDDTTISFDDTEVFYNPDSFIIDIVKFNQELVEYKEWQEIIGFQLPKIIDSKGQNIEFKNVELSQAAFDDRFYQKPN